MKLVFATNNRHKLEEVQALFRQRALPYELVTLAEAGIREDIPEEHETLEENARAKALFVRERTGFDCFADDTGLEVDALNGRPGVYSARYAGEGCSYEDNVNKLLREMEGKADRRARFRTVIHLVLGGEERRFDGVVEGDILDAPAGHGGFGYDPVFLPLGYGLSFAEMDLAEKNRISHRARAFFRLAEFLEQTGQEPR